MYKIVINNFEHCINLTEEQMILLEWLNDNDYLRDCTFMNADYIEFKDIK